MRYSTQLDNGKPIPLHDEAGSILAARLVRTAFDAMMAGINTVRPGAGSSIRWR